MSLQRLFHHVYFVMRILYVVIMVLAITYYIFYLWDIHKYGIPEPGRPSIEVLTWLDKNGDGQYETGESPLSGVCIYTSTTPFGYKDSSLECKNAQNVTNAEGFWSPSSFPDAYMFAELPLGFQYTTPPVVKAKSGDNIEFGFAPDSISVKNKIASVDAYSNSLFWQDGTRKAGVYILIAFVLMVTCYETWRIYIKMNSTK